MLRKWKLKQHVSPSTPAFKSTLYYTVILHYLLLLHADNQSSDASMWNVFNSSQNKFPVVVCDEHNMTNYIKNTVETGS